MKIVTAKIVVRRSAGSGYWVVKYHTPCGYGNDDYRSFLRWEDARDFAVEAARQGKVILEELQ